MPPVSRHLQCRITLYSNAKNITQIRNWDKGHGIDVVLFLLLTFYYYYHYDYYYGLKLSFMILAVFTFGVCHYRGCAFSMVRKLNCTFSTSKEEKSSNFCPMFSF